MEVLLQPFYRMPTVKWLHKGKYIGFDSLKGNANLNNIQKFASYFKQNVPYIYYEVNSTNGIQ
jgi:hypothetical protein